MPAVQRQRVGALQVRFGQVLIPGRCAGRDERVLKGQRRLVESEIQGQHRRVEQNDVRARSASQRRDRRQRVSLMAPGRGVVAHLAERVGQHRVKLRHGGRLAAAVEPLKSVEVRIACLVEPTEAGQADRAGPARATDQVCVARWHIRPGHRRQSGHRGLRPTGHSIGNRVEHGPPQRVRTARVLERGSRLLHLVRSRLQLDAVEQACGVGVRQMRRGEFSQATMLSAVGLDDSLDGRQGHRVATGRHECDRHQPACGEPVVSGDTVIANHRAAPLWQGLAFQPFTRPLPMIGDQRRERVGGRCTHRGDWCEPSGKGVGITPALASRVLEGRDAGSGELRPRRRVIHLEVLLPGRKFLVR